MKTRPRLIYYAVIFVAVAAVYSRAISAPFVFDDDFYVSGNGWIRSLGNFTDLTSMRYVADLSFALNYSLTGNNPVWFHLTNILIHLVNSALVFVLVELVLGAPLFKASYRDGGVGAATIAFLTALLFAVHPIETQAVTYVAQRYTSLAAMFYLLALVFFLKSRSLSLENKATGHGAKGRLYYAFSIVCTVLAMKTKEIAFTIPFAVALFEYALFCRDGGPRLRLVAPYLATLAIVPLNLFFLHPAGGGNLADGLMKARKIDDMRYISTYSYLITEPRVLLRYLRLLFYPSGQTFGYSWPLSRSLFEPWVLASSVFIISLLAWSSYCLARAARAGGGAAAAAALGVAWFFLTASVESSVIPIADVIAEHRAYLPSVGIIFAAVCALSAATRRLAVRFDLRTDERRFVITAALAASILLGAATYLRNSVWADKFKLYSYEAARNPDKVSPRLNLGGVYFESRMFPEAIREFKKAVDIKPEHLIARTDLAEAYMAAGMDDEAIIQYRAIIGLSPQNLRARLNLALLNIKRGRYKDAERELSVALAMTPGNENVKNTLELLKAGKGSKIVVK